MSFKLKELADPMTREILNRNLRETPNTITQPNSLSKEVEEQVPEGTATTESSSIVKLLQSSKLSENLSEMPSQSNNRNSSQFSWEVSDLSSQSTHSDSFSNSSSNQQSPPSVNDIQSPLSKSPVKQITEVRDAANTMVNAMNSIRRMASNVNRQRQQHIQSLADEHSRLMNLRNLPVVTLVPVNPRRPLSSPQFVVDNNTATSEDLNTPSKQLDIVRRKALELRTTSRVLSQSLSSRKSSYATAPEQPRREMSVSWAADLVAAASNDGEVCAPLYPSVDDDDVGSVIYTGQSAPGIKVEPESEEEREIVKNDDDKTVNIWKWLESQKRESNEIYESNGMDLSANLELEAEVKTENQKLIKRRPSGVRDTSENINSSNKGLRRRPVEQDKIFDEHRSLMDTSESLVSATQTIQAAAHKATATVNTITKVTNSVATMASVAAMAAASIPNPKTSQFEDEERKQRRRIKNEEWSQKFERSKSQQNFDSESKMQRNITAGFVFNNHTSFDKEPTSPFRYFDPKKQISLASSNLTAVAGDISSSCPSSGYLGEDSGIGTVNSDKSEKNQVSMITNSTNSNNHKYFSKNQGSMRIYSDDPGTKKKIKTDTFDSQSSSLRDVLSCMKEDNDKLIKQLRGMK
ncbi:hypothetical protein HK096_008229 [Nowakowskiella sp. JEL0078]|nr:hypothetical protein HK096_008229 [Nowakowskiella sp. JEL0078]